MKTLPLLAALALAAAPALAQNPVPFLYEQFEASVPHIDLDTCPAALAQGDVFCRVTLNSDALHVFVFESGGERAFVTMRTYYEDEFALDFGG